MYGGAINDPKNPPDWKVTLMNQNFEIYGALCNKKAYILNH